MVCGVPIETDLATIQKHEEEQARARRAAEAVKEAREFLWLTLFLMFSTIALRSVLIHGNHYVHYPNYRVPVSFVEARVQQPREALPIPALEITLPGQGD
jgi:hypothetical protein